MNTKILKVDGFYIEASEIDSDLIIKENNDELVGGIPLLEDKVQSLKGTISSLCSHIKESFNNDIMPDELEIEFGIKIGGEAGIPFISKGNLESNFVIKAKWMKVQIKN